MNLCIDLDGVVCAYPFPELVKQYFGVEIDAESLFAYDLADVLGVSHKSIDKMFEEQVNGMPCFIPGAIETLREWEGRGDRIYILSNRVKYMGGNGLAVWLEKWKIPFWEITDGIETFDFAIDDSPAKLMSVKSTFRILYSQPWNKRCFDVTKTLKRAKNWKDVKRIVG